jgi:putative Mn2+ efflux pump MntP
MISLVFIALSLSLDALAVSISSAVCVRDLKFFHALRASFFFGLFQFVMPLAGWYFGSAFSAYIEAFDHWIAFGLLAFIGGKMIFEAFSAKTRRGEKPADIRSPGTLLSLAVATSIDALAVGLSFNMINKGIWINAAVIGAVTFLVCLAGFEFGRRIGALPEKWANVAGGLVLIGIGVKTLLEHLPG